MFTNARKEDRTKKLGLSLAFFLLNVTGMLSYLFVFQPNL